MSTNPSTQHNYPNGIPMIFLKTNRYVVAATAMLALNVPHFARGAETPSRDGTKTEQTATVADMADGEVRKVDKDAKKVTIKHGEIKSLDMPAMTMVFRLNDAAMLDTLKVGDKIRFKAEREKGTFVISEVIPMK